MATSLAPDDLPNRTDGRACDESCAGANQDLQDVSQFRTSGWTVATALYLPEAEVGQFIRSPRRRWRARWAAY